MNKWNAISLHIRTIVLKISHNTRIEFLIDTKDEETKRRLDAALKGWDEARH